MRTSAIPAAQTVVQYCKAANIQHVVISPGSRNAPMTIGFTEDPYFSCYSIVDERCAAFFALGLAQQLRQVVALVCTSGSALLNYYPAIAEAFYSRLPLLVLSADRPPYNVDIGDGQTIRQDSVYGYHIGFSTALKQDVTHATAAILAAGLSIPEDKAGLRRLQAEIQEHNEKQLTGALAMALTEMLPVHVNIPLEEPLYRTEDLQATASEINLPNTPYPDWEMLPTLAEIWQNASRKMVIIGNMHPGAIDSKYLALLAEDPSVLVFTETTSNCHHPDFFPSIDSIVAPLEKKADQEDGFLALQPEVLLTMGGMVVSKKIKALLRRFRPAHHWHIDQYRGYDTYYSLSHHFKSSPDTFFKAFHKYMAPGKKGYRAKWADEREAYRRKRCQYLKEIPFSDFLAFDRVLAGIPEKYQLQLANSSTVRYTQLFDLRPSLRVFCNRGTSGIDGSTSTAIGASLAVSEPTLLITGDLSFLYDSNAFWNDYMRPDFRVIVVNNLGGGIFRILPGHEETDRFKTYFETVQNLELRKICELHRLEYSCASETGELEEALEDFYRPSLRPRVLEVKTPREVNDKILLAYFEYLS